MFKLDFVFRAVPKACLPVFCSAPDVKTASHIISYYATVYILSLTSSRLACSLSTEIFRHCLQLRQSPAAPAWASADPQSLHPRPTTRQRRTQPDKLASYMVSWAIKLSAAKPSRALCRSLLIQVLVQLHCMHAISLFASSRPAARSPAVHLVSLPIFALRDRREPQILLACLLACSCASW